MRGPLGWGDAIAAAKQLGLQRGSEIADLVDLLGLTLTPVSAAEEPPDTSETIPATQTVPPGVGPTSTPVSTDEDDGLAERRTLVEELTEQPLDTIKIDAEPLAEPSITAGAMPYESPIVENQLRAAIAALVRSKRRSNRIDLSKAIGLVAEQRPFERLPMLEEPTTRMGVSVVADISTVMMPYLADVDRFIVEVEHVVGRPNVTVAWFGDIDIETDSGDREFAFEAERPVLVISTLGATPLPGEAAAARMRWSRFVESAKEVNVDVVALVPHRLPAWPDQLADLIRIVAWDDLPQVGRGRG